MDVAYDHIQEEAALNATTTDEAARDSNSSSSNSKEQGGPDGQRAPAGLNAEFQEAFKAVSASPWGARIGGLWGQVRRQGETLYSSAQQEVAHVSTQATRGLTDLQTNIAQRAQGLSLPKTEGGEDAATTSFSDPNFALPPPSPASPTKTIRAGGATGSGDEGSSDNMATERGGGGGGPVENLPADIVKEASNMVSKLRLTAAGRLESIRRAEDAADEALLKFGTNIRSFFRDAVTVSAPSGDSEGGEDVTKEVLFETNDSEGKRVFHSSRLEAQMHVIVSAKESFLKDPESGEWGAFKDGWDVEKKTEEIAKELERYDELRKVFGGLVPEKVEYGAFWARYYFLKGVVEEEERRRKEVLKGAAADAGEEVGWDDDEEEEEDDDDESTTPVNGGKTDQASQSTTTLTPSKAGEGSAKSPREDDLKSTADSDTSYDIVSGATSKTPSSPKEAAKEAKKDNSDDEDWE